MRLEDYKLPVVAIVSLGIGAAGGVYAKTSSKAELTLVAAADAKFAPVDPTHPSPQVAVLSGNPTTGPVAFLLKVDKGAAPVHWHTSDYYIVTLKGQTKHWLAGKESGAKPNPEETFWFQPGGSVQTAHGDECLSDGGCLAFVFMPGKLDLKIVPPPAKK